MIAEDTKVDEDEDTTIYDQTMTMITDDDWWTDKEDEQMTTMMMRNLISEKMKIRRWRIWYLRRWRYNDDEFWYLRYDDDDIWEDDVPGRMMKNVYEEEEFQSMLEEEENA